MSEQNANTEKMSEILTERRGNVGLITLNRPKALNALSLAMVHELLATLLAWRDDPAVHLVAIRGTQAGCRLELTSRLRPQRGGRRVALASYHRRSMKRRGLSK